MHQRNVDPISMAQKLARLDFVQTFSPLKMFIKNVGMPAPKNKKVYIKYPLLDTSIGKKLYHLYLFRRCSYQMFIG